jgi:hypothetical protein
MKARCCCQQHQLLLLLSLFTHIMLGLQPKHVMGGVWVLL